jgi:hypothetical protein
MGFSSVRCLLLSVSHGIVLATPIHTNMVQSALKAVTAWERDEMEDEMRELVG